MESEQTWPVRSTCEGRIDGDHAVVAGDEAGIVDVGGGMEFEDRIVIDEVEDALGAENESEDNFARLEVLALAGDDAGFDQRDDAVGDEFAVDAEILAVHEHGKNSVGNAADAGLQDGAVFDQAGDVAGDGDVQIGDLGLFHGAERPRFLDEDIEIVT